MRRQPPSFRSLDGSPEDLCLGIVVFPKADCLAEALAELAQLSDLELGETQDHRIPCVAISKVGRDEALLQRIESLPSVLKAEVVYAEVLASEVLSTEAMTAPRDTSENIS